jgi:hypothetical protein
MQGHKKGEASREKSWKRLKLLVEAWWDGCWIPLMASLVVDCCRVHNKLKDFFQSSRRLKDTWRHASSSNQQTIYSESSKTPKNLPKTQGHL